MEDVEKKKHQLPIFTLKSQDKLINKKKTHTSFWNPTWSRQGVLQAISLALNLKDFRTWQLKLCVSPTVEA